MCREAQILREGEGCHRATIQFVPSAKQWSEKALKLPEHKTQFIETGQATRR
jgi:hypothetical protein